jgi:hypothetical protein
MAGSCEADKRNQPGEEGEQILRRGGSPYRFDREIYGCEVKRNGHVT